MTTPQEKEARRHRAIIEIPMSKIVAFIGLPPEFKCIGCTIRNEDDMLRIKLQHPIFPSHNEGEIIPTVDFLDLKE